MTFILETDRLTSRTRAHEDEVDLFEIFGDSNLMKYIGTGKPFKTRKEAEEFLVWVAEYQKERNWILPLGGSRKIGFTGNLMELNQDFVVY